MIFRDPNSIAGQRCQLQPANPGLTSRLPRVVEGLSAVGASVEGGLARPSKPLERICKIVGDIFGLCCIATVAQRVRGFEHERPSLFPIEHVLIDERSQQRSLKVQLRCYQASMPFLVHIERAVVIIAHFFTLLVRYWLVPRRREDVARAMSLSDLL
jgi:hypothetical protein